MSSSHQRWRDLLAAEARGEPLCDEDAAYLEAEVVDSDRAWEESLWQGLGGLAQRPLSGERPDEEVEQAALQAFWNDPAGASSELEAAPVRRRRWPWVAGGAALVAGLAAAVSLVVTPGPNSSAITEPVRATQSEPLAAAPKGTRASLQAPTPPPAEQEAFEVPPGCVEDAGVIICLEGDGAVAKADDRAHRLDRGSALLRGSDESEPVWLDTPLARLRGGDAHFRATVSDDGRSLVVQVYSGRVAAWRDGRRIGYASASAPLYIERSRVEAPARPQRERQRAAKPSAGERLRRAQEQMTGGDIDGALETYRALVERHPNSPAARNALVTIGRLELKRGRSGDALEAFERYLRGPGRALREEAAYGAIRALRALGRTQAEQRAIEAFFVDHPQSVYVPRLRRRVATLTTSR